MVYLHKQVKKFSRSQQDFICQNCSLLIKGDGYTNHCSNCFYSKHVDLNPGDRMSSCLGLMQPVTYETHSRKNVIITHKCLKCLIIKRNKIAKTDDISKLIDCFKI